MSSGSASNGDDSPSESILEALDEIGDSKECHKGYDSEEYDAAMKEFEAQLTLGELEKNQVAAIASRPYVHQFRPKKGCMKVNTTSAVHNNSKKGGGGVVIHDHDGCFIARACHFSPLLVLEYVELRSCWSIWESYILYLIFTNWRHQRKHHVDSQAKQNFTRLICLLSYIIRRMRSLHSASS
jgi:hypothetical protein